VTRRLSAGVVQDIAAVDYVSISALDGSLAERLHGLLARGDVYMHCMYGHNRTGFAAARYATAMHIKIDRGGLSRRDYALGAAFEKRRGAHTGVSSSAPFR